MLDVVVDDADLAASRVDFAVVVVDLDAREPFSNRLRCTAPARRR